MSISCATFQMFSVTCGYYIKQDRFRIFPLSQKVLLKSTAPYPTWKIANNGPHLKFSWVLEDIGSLLEREDIGSLLETVEIFKNREAPEDSDTI